MSSTSHRLPRLIVGETDFRSLQMMAMSGTNYSDEDADALLHEMDRARVVPDPRVPQDVVRMGSTVGYTTENGEQAEVTLVYPGKADISSRAISVLTPVGTALIGLRVGQTMSWTARGGRKRSLKVTRVRQPEPVS